MELTTIRQFAKRKGVSYEAVRRQVARYHDELRDHIVVKNRTQYLDEWAVEFLSNRRRESPVVMVTEDQRDQIDQMSQEIETLRAKLASTQEELINAQGKIIGLQEEAQKAIEDRTKYTLLLENQQRTENELRETLQRTETEIETLTRERDAAQAEVGTFKRSIFGFYRKV